MQQGMLQLARPTPRGASEPLSERQAVLRVLLPVLHAVAALQAEGVHMPCLLPCQIWVGAQPMRTQLLVLPALLVQPAAVVMTSGDDTQLQYLAPEVLAQVLGRVPGCMGPGWAWGREASSNCPVPALEGARGCSAGRWVVCWGVGHAAWKHTADSAVMQPLLGVPTLHSGGAKLGGY